MKLTVGSKIRFAEEKQRYTVQAADSRFAICTKPMNAKRTVIYTIIDFELGIRGTENLIFCLGFETRAACQRALQRLRKGESEVSHRNRVPLRILDVRAKHGLS